MTTEVAGGAALVSWSGSMFEYLMPSLIMRAPDLHATTVAHSLEACGFAVRSVIIWDKTRLVIGRGDYHWQHEPAAYCVRKGKSGHWAGGRNQTTVWQIPHRRNASGHGTEKPVECMKRPIENNSSPGQAGV